MMIKETICMAMLLYSISASAQPFKAGQLKYERARGAYEHKEDTLKALLKEKGIESFNIELFMRAFKKDKKFEVWVRERGTEKYTKLLEWDICASSGMLGPKRKEGDRQVPEGFYHVMEFLPWSEYHLGLWINYPNADDLKHADPQKPGGQIVIHGKCCTIGCIPLTDDKIEELYVLAVEARAHGQQKIQVHIFPTHLDSAGMAGLTWDYADRPDLLDFWKRLQHGYLYFEAHRQPPACPYDLK